MAVSELCPAGCGLCFWPALASWSYVLAGPGLLETMLWQTLFWEVSGGPCAPGGAFVQPINEERRMAVSELWPASFGLCFWPARASWSYVLAGPGFLETMLWQALFWELSGGPCACGGAFVGPINEERRMAVLGLCPASSGLCFWLARASWSYVLAGPGFLETMLWQALFWVVSGGPCACGGAFVGPINEERRMAVLGLCPASSGLCFWRARASWSYVLAGPGFLETMLWQALFWVVSGGPCACGGAFDRPNFKEGRMAVSELCCLKLCFGKLCFGRFWGPLCLWRRFRPTNF